MNVVTAGDTLHAGTKARMVRERLQSQVDYLVSQQDAEDLAQDDAEAFYSVLGTAFHSIEALDHIEHAPVVTENGSFAVIESAERMAVRLQSFCDESRTGV